jgi:hypothetical protein
VLTTNMLYNLYWFIYDIILPLCEWCSWVKYVFLPQPRITPRYPFIGIHGQLPPTTDGLYHKHVYASHALTHSRDIPPIGIGRVDIQYGCDYYINTSDISIHHTCLLVSHRWSPSCGIHILSDLYPILTDLC